MAFNNSGVTVARLLAVSFSLTKIPTVPSFRNTSKGYGKYVTSKTPRQNHTYRYDAFEDQSSSEEDNQNDSYDDENEFVF